MSAVLDPASWSALDATALRDEIVHGRCSARAAVESALARIAALDPPGGGGLGAFLAVDAEGARERAAHIDARLAAGDDPGPLCGVPVALKANMAYAGRVVSCASRILEHWRAPYDATFVARLLAAGAIPVGTTNMDEFAMGSSGENSAFYPTHNPWARGRTPGGSSSGSAAAVAAGIVPLALGSDTGGSVRQPAALCGIFGLKPTYGTISRYGLVAFGSSLDQVAPLARSARDLELALEVISGHDERDSTSLPYPAFERRSPAARDLAGLRVGVPREILDGTLEGLEEDVRARTLAALESLRTLGAAIQPVELPHLSAAIATYYVVATAEASANLARYDGVRYGLRVDAANGTLQGMFAATREAGFGREVKRRILLGTYVLSAGWRDAWYDRALRVRRLVAGDYEAAFAGCDLIVGPTSPTPAFRLGERTQDPVAMYAADALTVPVSLAGLPAVSAPCGFVERDGERLPVGLQFVGPPRADGRVLGAARVFETATDHASERPPCALGEAPA